MRKAFLPYQLSSNWAYVVQHAVLAEKYTEECKSSVLLQAGGQEIEMIVIQDYTVRNALLHMYGAQNVISCANGLMCFTYVCV